MEPDLLRNKLQLANYGHEYFACYVAVEEHCRCRQFGVVLVWRGVAK